jgi:oligopeptidase B
LPRAGGAEEVLVDGDRRAEGKTFYRVGAGAHSPDHTKFAWSEDELGSEMMTIRMRDVERAEDLPDRIVNATDDIVWTRDSHDLLYVEQDESHRPFRVMLHRLGTEQGEDVEIFAERDLAWFIGVEPTCLGRVGLVVVHGHDGSETHVVDLDEPTGPLRLVAPRRPGFFYDVMDHGDGFYIRANAGARDFKIIVAPRNKPDESQWRDVVAPLDGRFIAAATLFRDYLVLVTREDARPRLSIIELISGAAHDVAFDEETYALGFGVVYEFDTRLIRFR